MIALSNNAKGLALFIGDGSLLGTKLQYMYY